MWFSLIMSLVMWVCGIILSTWSNLVSTTCMRGKDDPINAPNMLQQVVCDLVPVGGNLIFLTNEAEQSCLQYTLQYKNWLSHFIFYIIFSIIHIFWIHANLDHWHYWQQPHPHYCDHQYYYITHTVTFKHSMFSSLLLSDLLSWSKV